MATEYLSFAGWERNLKLSNGIVEVIITLEVGPRIISYRPVEGRSVFKLVDEEAASRRRRCGGFVGDTGYGSLRRTLARKIA
jgi:hypothetical protein